MAKSSDILQALLSEFPISELGNDEHRSVFERIKRRLIEAPDSGDELKNLYRVKGLADFATGLMWMVDRAEKNPGHAAIGPQDETLLLSSFRRAMGESPASGEKSTPTASGDSQTFDEHAYASQVEQVSDAVQGGSSGLKMLVEDLVAASKVIAGRGTPAELTEFSSLIAEFLNYVVAGELLDDVRVINILSNISSDILQWSSTPPEHRAEILEEAVGVLRDFKSHFE